MFVKYKLEKDIKRTLKRHFWRVRVVVDNETLRQGFTNTPKSGSFEYPVRHQKYVHSPRVPSHLRSKIICQNLVVQPRQRNGLAPTHRSSRIAFSCPSKIPAHDPAPDQIVDSSGIQWPDVTIFLAAYDAVRFAETTASASPTSIPNEMVTG